MTIFSFYDNINTTLASSITSSATSLTLSSSTNFPSSVPSGTVFALTLNDVATRAVFEVVYVTAISGATCTVTRGQEGTTAVAWLNGSYVYSGPTSGQMTSVNAGRFVREVILTATSTYYSTPGISFITVEAQGGGGSAGGSPATTSAQTSAGGGGGSGAWVYAKLTTGFSGGIVCTIGFAGTGQSGGGGFPGSATTFGSVLSAGGGNGGSVAGPTGASNFNAAPGAGGTASGGSINLNGSYGNYGIVTVGNGIPLGITPGYYLAGYGAGAAPNTNPPSTGAVTGSSGIAGIMIIREYS